MNQDSCIAAEKAWIEIQDNVKGISISVLRILASLLTEVRFHITTENGGQRIEIFRSPLRVHESRCMLSAWIEILASLLRMCESRFRHLPLKMKSKILVFIWDSKISYSHLAVENVNWHSHGPTQKERIVIPMSLFDTVKKDCVTIQNVWSRCPCSCSESRKGDSHVIENSCILRWSADLRIKAKRSAPTPSLPLIA